MQKDEIGSKCQSDEPSLITGKSQDLFKSNFSFSTNQSSNQDFSRQDSNKDNELGSLPIDNFHSTEKEQLKVSDYNQTCALILESSNEHSESSGSQQDKSICRTLFSNNLYTNTQHESNPTSSSSSECDMTLLEHPVFWSAFIANLSIELADEKVKWNLLNKFNLHESWKKKNIYQRQEHRREGREEGKEETIRKGDFICPQCGNLNFKHRTECGMCGQAKAAQQLKVIQCNHSNNQIAYKWCKNTDCDESEGTGGQFVNRPGELSQRNIDDVRVTNGHTTHLPSKADKSLNLNKILNNGKKITNGVFSKLSKQMKHKVIN